MTIFNEIERDAKNGTPDNWGYKPCQCGHPNCDQNTMDNQGSVGFSLDDARRIANVPRYERAIMAAKELADAVGEEADADGILRTEKHADAEAIGSQAAEIERLRDFLREIAKPKVGPDFDWTDAEINKWRASWYREYENIARAALAQEAQTNEAAATDVMEWQPIETAPKDGTPILIARRFDDDPDFGELDGGVVAQGMWLKGYGDAPDEMGHDAGWIDIQFSDFAPARSFGNPAYRTKGAQPTHWMPMPPLPEAQTNE